MSEDEKKVNPAVEEMLNGLKATNEFKFWYDNDEEKNVAFIAIPLKGLVKDVRLGTIVLRGWMDQCRDELLLWIRLIRQKESKRNIIQPAATIPSDLKIIQ